MPTASNPAPILDRLVELRTVFEAGQRAVSFAEELSSLICDVLPLLAEIDGSLRESADQMPAATLQIQSVTEATEVATTEILDLVDAVRARLSPPAPPDGPPRPADRLRLLLRDRLADAALRADAEALLDEADAAEAARAEAEATRLGEARRDLDRILVSLQVQDITAQQLASVNHLIESVRYRLNKLVRWVSAEGGAAADDDGPPVDAGTFDADARYVRPDSLQADVDRAAAEALASGDGASAAAGPTSQDDIDALFGA